MTWKRKKHIEPAPLPQKAKVAIKTKVLFLSLLINGLLIIGIAFFYFSQKHVFLRPNVILITVDALRPDHLGCYGYHRNTSPNIDKLAREGVIFNNAIAQAPWTAPSVTSFMTSLYPSAHKIVDKTKRLGSSVKTLPLILKKNGYLTGAFTGTTGYAGRVFHGKGFDVFMEDLKPAPALTRKVTQWLRQVKDESFFLFLHYMDVHSDYDTSPPPYRNMYDPDYKGSITGKSDELIGFNRRKVVPPKRDIEHLIALYDGGINYTDKYLGELFNELDILDIKDNTLIIFSADHGEEFFEHGSSFHVQLYDELVKVPLIMRLPGKMPRGRVIDSQVRTIDIMPTILDILRIPIDHKIQGVNLLNIIHGKKKSNLPALIETDLRMMGRVRALRTEDGWKFIYHLKKKTSELYNLKNDPGETNNLAEEYPQKAKELEKRLFKQLEENRAFLVDTEEGGELTPAVKKRLRSLGYAQ